MSMSQDANQGSDDNTPPANQPPYDSPPPSQNPYDPAPPYNPPPTNYGAPQNPYEPPQNPYGAPQNFYRPPGYGVPPPGAVAAFSRPTGDQVYIHPLPLKEAIRQLPD